MPKFKYLILFLIALVLLCDNGGLLAETPKAPETLEETKAVGERILWGLPEVFKGLWQEAREVWGKMLSWFKNIWNSYIYSWFWDILGKEVEKRKPEIQEKFEKEKKEMKEEIKIEVPKISESLWQRFKELVK